jgi:hypothetical protein
VQSSPEAARLTLLELIVGALLASDVTQAILARIIHEAGK